LHSVKLIDGAIALFGADAQPIAKAEAINGEFSADALAGPFKFKGQASWSGEPRDIKFATTLPGSDGAFRIKANIRATKSATTYMLDGNIEDLSGNPRLTGELTGKLPLDGSSDAGSAPANAEPPVLDLKSHIEADTAGAKVEDIALSLDNATEPQLISGSATAVWGKEQRLDIALASKWLDLDRLAGAGQDSASFVRVKRLGLSSLRALAGDGGGVAGAKIDVDQVKLGGETAGGLKINAESRGAAVHLTELKAGLPGGSRLDLTGDLKDDNGKVRFAGSGFVHGTNLARLLAWAAKSGAHLDVAADGAFSAEGRMVVDDARFELTEASAEIGGRPFSGDVVVSGDGRRKVAVTLEGARLDSSELFPETSRTLEDNLRRAFGFSARVAKQDGASSPVGTAKAPSERSSSDKGSSETGDISVRVLAGELKHGDQVFRNVDATVGLDGGSIRIPSAKFTTASGLAVALDGRIDNAASEPRGTLAYDIAGRTPESLNDFASITGLNSVIPAARIAATGSAKLAGLVHLGGRGAATADVSVDGTVELAYVSGHAEFDGGLQGWRSAPSRVRLTAHAPALMPLLAAFGFEGGAATQPGAHEAELVFASSGPIASGSAAVLQISAPGFDASYNGRMALPADGALSLAGNVSLKADDVLDAMAVAGLTGAGGLSGVPVEGDVEIKRESGAWSLASRRLATGSSVLSGTARIATGGPGPAALSADLHAGTISVAGLLSGVSGKLAADVPAKSDAWPEAGFAFDSLSGVAGDVRVGFDTLSIQPGIAAHQGSFKLQVGPGKVTMSDLTGRAAGGTLAGTVQLAKSASGVSLDSAIKINGANLAELGAAAKGKAGIEFKANAQAQSPAALVASLSGDGAVTLDGARLPVPGPATGTEVVAAVIANKIPNQPGDIADSFRAAAQTASTELGSRKIPFVIADGVAKLQPITLDSNDGTVSAVTTIDLSLLAMDSAWRVAPFVPPLAPPHESLPGWVAPPAKGTLPPASIVYTGRLADLKSVVVNADAADLQRELAVRLVERKLEELERLKMQDQQRVRAEQERRQTIEAERAAAAAAAKATAAGQTPAPAMPPVIPESAGTSGAPPASAPAASGTASPPAQQGGIAIEPDPQAAAAAAAAGAPIVPDAGLPRPQPVRTAPPRTVPSRRTSSDEVLRSLGGIP
jgi:hypothetical protein